MPTLGQTNLNVSPLGLGTVEIGLPYGIDIKTLPSDKEAERILKTAVELGITYFDTARGYGVAEERIGKFGISQLDGIVVGTKCAQFLREEPDLTGPRLERRIREEVDTSRQNLKLTTLPLLQLHIESPDFDNLEELIEIMRKLQAEEKVQHIGLACRGEKVPLAALQVLNNQSDEWRPLEDSATGLPADLSAEDLSEVEALAKAGPVAVVETIQTAYSILDQRMAAKVLPQAKAKNAGVICRSVLLKGALTPAAEKLPPKLTPLKNNSRAAAKIAAALGTDLPTLAIRFAAFHPAISTILIGTVTPDHLKTALAAIEAGPLPNDILQKLATLAIDDPSQIDPSQWPKI